MKKSYAHQREILKDDPEKCGIFTGTGTGKTRIALMLAKGTTMVIAPKTQVEDRNWEREYKTLGKNRIRTLSVISKETFRRDMTTLPRVDTLIVDEAHSCLGITPNVRWRDKVAVPKASQLYEALEAYVKYAKPKRIYLVTATIMRSPMTVYAAGVILGRIRGTMADFYNFRDTYYVQLPMAFRQVYTPSGNTRTKNSLAKLVRKYGYVGRLEDFFDVPEQTFKTDYVPLLTEQQRAIDELPLEYPDPLVRLTKEHQVENGVLNGDEFNDAQYFDNRKIERIKEYALEFPKMVVFAKYRAQIEYMASTLKKEAYRVITLTGDTKDRGKAISEANKAKSCIFIAQCQVSAGWELPLFPVMVFASRTYSWVDYQQAIGRIHRANALKKNLYINLVVKGGVDQAVDKALANKSDFDARIYLGI